ncbi:hypothetical protein SERLA73DRAFT_69015 [Serpula lacrymans var. lacrymans S7.3]|uniref:Uncharacterized protein n=1 Tax=Serpula lacrymans var. lacrymans (strain S7.3) TaxID=936435 RepID=F8PGH1_SERL3|nr:hypothetical protein SERLA73DRAFT_69015 [Serpula lacrymans var. lacrymans S7.3]
MGRSEYGKEGEDWRGGDSDNERGPGAFVSLGALPKQKSQPVFHFRHNQDDGPLPLLSPPLPLSPSPPSPPRLIHPHPPLKR